MRIYITTSYNSVDLFIIGKYFLKASCLLTFVGVQRVEFSKVLKKRDFK